MMKFARLLHRAWPFRAKSDLSGNMLAMANGPWGEDGKPSEPAKGEGDEKPAEGPRNPWTQPGGGQRPSGGARPSMVDDLIRRGREGFSGIGGGRGPGGGGMPRTPDGKALWPIAVVIVAVLWIAMSSVHRIGPQERGVVLMLGKYSRTLTPGVSLTLPAPLETVQVIDVEEIRTIDIGSVDADDKNLMLTRDQNIIDLAYSVRWNIRAPEQYAFQIADPDTTIKEVAESAMRAAISTVSLNEALGAGRTVLEQQVAANMQAILNSYNAGVRVQGIAIKQADPPAAVNDAFKEVSAAQQAAQTDVNQAAAYAAQLTARAQGEAAAFDKVYEQYRLSPDVTRKRMYYETMEAVLAGIDKTIVEPGGVNSYLPLPEIKRRASAADAATQGAQ
jgi:modulator of FtsH protease HflK